MNPLNDMPGLRKALYLVQWIYNGVLTVMVAVLAIQQTPLADAPQWYLYAAGVGPVLWTYLGITAQSNVEPERPYEDPH